MLRLSEHYVSVQGEGPRVGQLTQFVRFAGCNMRCPLWPCDTQHAIDPEIYMHNGNSEKLTAKDFSNAIVEMYLKTGASNICFTGGEPFLQKHEDLRHLCNYILGFMPFTLECFTNGSFEFPKWTKYPEYNMLFNMDWKLPGSGEAETKVDIRRLNALKHLHSTDGIKFVIKTRNDLLYAHGVYNDLIQHGYRGQFWVGRVWDGPISNQELVSYISGNRLPWKLNIQMHKYIWPADERGV